MNDALTKYRTKLELLQALARRRSERSRSAVKTRVELDAELPVKVSPKATLVSA